MTLMTSDFTSDWAQDPSTLDRVHVDLKLVQQSIATDVVAECLTEFQAIVSQFCANLREACVAQDPLFVPRSSPHSHIFAESATIMWKGRRTQREVPSAGAALILDGSPSDTQAGGIDDSMTRFVRECGGRSEGRFAEDRVGADPAQCSVFSVDGRSGREAAPSSSRKAQETIGITSALKAM